MANSFGARATLSVGGRDHVIYRLDAAGPSAARLPYSLKVLLENLLRNEDGVVVRAEDIEALADWDPDHEPDREIAFTPARILMQDFTGVPAVVDLAAMRDAMAAIGGDPGRINPLVPAELVIDHSIVADVYGVPDAFVRNAELEFERNGERYQFLRWGQPAFDNLRVVPPNTGICHQVNLEYLSRVVFADDDGNAYPDTLVGTDSHTPMVNGLGVLGWGVGGIEAEAAMLGQPISMLMPRVVGFKLHGELPEGATATDLVLTVTELLRRHGVVGKFVEFYGPGVAAVPLENRATIGNMSPEYGSTIAIFPIDDETLRYLRFTGRSDERSPWSRPTPRSRACGTTSPRPSPCSPNTSSSTWPPSSRRSPGRRARRTACPSTGPRRCSATPSSRRCPTWWTRATTRPSAESFPASDPPSSSEGITGVGEPGRADPLRTGTPLAVRPTKRIPVSLADGTSFDLDHGHVVIAAITSCTNTSNPSVMVAAGLLAKNAVERGLTVQAVGQDLAGARLEGRHGLLRPRRPAPLPRQAPLQPRRLRLHHLHRQLRPAASRDLPGRQRQRPRRRRPCCRATATSRAASTPTCA